MTNQPTPRLVPDWVRPDGPAYWVGEYRNDRAVIDALDKSLYVHGDLSKEMVRDLLPALAFFAREGRLPTREDEPTIFDQITEGLDQSTPAPMPTNENINADLSCDRVSYDPKAQDGAEGCDG